MAFARGCSSLSDFVYRHDLLARKLVSQGYNTKKLRDAFSKFMLKYTDLVSKYNIQVSKFFKDHLPL